jgi:hypothetical protein
MAVVKISNISEPRSFIIKTQTKIRRPIEGKYQNSIMLVPYKLYKRTIGIRIKM